MRPGYIILILLNFTAILLHLFLVERKINKIMKATVIRLSTRR